MLWILMKDLRIILHTLVKKVTSEFSDVIFPVKKSRSGLFWKTFMLFYAEISGTSEVELIKAPSLESIGSMHSCNRVDKIFPWNYELNSRHKFALLLLVLTNKHPNNVLTLIFPSAYNVQLWLQGDSWIQIQTFDHPVFEFVQSDEH